MKFKRYMRAIKDRERDFVHYIFFAALRVVFVFQPQIGYVHPDEFFQSIEPFAGDVFNIEAVRTWEFNSTFPIRSAAVPYIYLKMPLNALKFVSLYTNYYFGLSLHTSYALLTFCRAVMCALSFFNDFSCYRICRTYGLKYDTRLLVLASSYVTLVYGIRTFSNTVEMVLCSLLLYLVSECMIHSNTVIYQREFLEKKYRSAKTIVERVQYFKLKVSLPSHSLNKCLQIATLCVLGVFNRPTFLVFGMPIVFQWLLRGMGTRSVSFFDFNIRMALFLISALPALLFCILVDSLYYGFLTLSEIENFDIGMKNFVVTPLNFLRYNLDPEKTAEHGVHPKWLHVLVNIPLLFNILGVITVVNFMHMTYRLCAKEYHHLPRSQSFVGLMTSAVAVPVIALSLINHQEARFLIPIALPMVLLHGSRLKTGLATTNPFKNRLGTWLFDHFLAPRASRTHLLRVWYTINLLCTFFFGFLHQGGVYPLATHFGQLMATKTATTQVHLVTSHLYMMPLSFLHLPSSAALHTNPATGQKFRRARQLFVYEYGALPLPALYRKLKLILDVNEMRTAAGRGRYELYLALPASLTAELNAVLLERSLLAYRAVRTFYPHLSLEAPPDVFGHHPCDVNTDLEELASTCPAADSDPTDLSVEWALKRFSALAHQFGLVLYRVEVKRGGHGGGGGS